MIVEPDLWSLSEDELAHVEDLHVRLEGVGAVTFRGETDCRQLVHNLPNIVILQPGEVVVYPDPACKPPVGTDLNKPSDITLWGCMPKSQTFKDQKARDKYTKRVKQMTEGKGAEFVDYDCDDGVWRFRVKHF